MIIVYAIDASDLSVDQCIGLMIDLEDELCAKGVEFQVNQIEDDYVVVTAGKKHLDSVQAHGNGTHVVTIKDAP